jgi:hypothetical protein
MTRQAHRFALRGLRLAINGRPSSQMLGPRGVFTAPALPPNPKRAAQIARFLAHHVEDVRHIGEAR